MKKRAGGFRAGDPMNPSKQRRAVRAKPKVANLVAALPAPFQSGPFQILLERTGDGKRLTPAIKAALMLAAFAYDVVPEMTKVLSRGSQRFHRLQADILAAASNMARKLTTNAKEPVTISSLMADRMDDLRLFIDSHPTWCRCIGDIVSRFKDRFGNRMSEGQVKYLFKLARDINEPFRHLTVRRQPKLMTMTNAEAYIQFTRDASKFPEDATICYYDQFPISTEAGKGASSALKATMKLYASFDTEAYIAEGRHSPGKTYQVSILICNNRIIKLWTHGLMANETGISKKGDTMDGNAVQFFFNGTQTVPPKLRTILIDKYGCDPSVLGGPPVPELLKQLKIRHAVILVDNLGRSGMSLRPMKAHFNADLAMSMAKAGHTWYMLPPGGCEANPVELANGYIQRAVAHAMPDDVYLAGADSSSTLGGTTCRPQLLYLLAKAMTEINEKEGYLQGCYDERGDGKRIHELLESSSAGQFVLELRAERAERALPLPQRRMFLAHKKREFETLSGQRFELQSLTELAKQRCTDPMAYRAQIVPWVTTEHRYYELLAAADVLNNTSNTTAAPRVKISLHNADATMKALHSELVDVLDRLCDEATYTPVADTPHNAHVSVKLRNKALPEIPLPAMRMYGLKLSHKDIGKALLDLFPDATFESMEHRLSHEVAEVTGLVHHCALVKRRLETEEKRVRVATKQDEEEELEFDNKAAASVKSAFSVAKGTKRPRSSGTKKVAAVQQQRESKRARKPSRKLAELQ